MNAYCPECETELDVATGICPACRWDPLVTRTVVSQREQERESEGEAGRDAHDGRVAAGQTWLKVSETSVRYARRAGRIPDRAPRAIIAGGA